MAINKLLGYEVPQLSIACLYLCTVYLKSMVGGRKNWRLLTDINEWLGILRSEEKRSEAIEFIREHHDRIRSYNRLHAKVVIGNELAMLGSANFPKMGLREREEVAVLIDDSPIIQELQDWFNGIWNRAGLPTNEQLEHHIVQLSKVERVSVPRLSSKGKTYTTRPPQLNSLDYAERYKRLIKSVEYAPNHTWINYFFDRVKDVIGITNMEDGDPRLIMAVWKNNGYIGLSLNHRWVLSAYYKNVNNKQRKDHAAIGFVVSKHYELPIDTSFASFSHAFSYKGKNKGNLRYIVAITEDVTAISDELLTEWRKSVRYQAENEKNSGKKGSHDPLVYRAAIDLDFRKDLLDEAFPG